MLRINKEIKEIQADHEIYLQKLEQERLKLEELKRIEEERRLEELRLQEEERLKKIA